MSEGDLAVGKPTRRPLRRGGDIGPMRDEDDLDADGLHRASEVGHCAASVPRLVDRPEGVDVEAARTSRVQHRKAAIDVVLVHFKRTRVQH